MNIENLKKSTDWFKVNSLRKIDDPSHQIDRREIVVSLDQYPAGFGLGPNPRRPDLKSRVSKEIRATLEENGDNFHLLNRGITILAKDLEYDNKTERIKLKLHDNEDEEHNFGILDGGNTNAQINDWRESLPEESLEALKRRHVNVQVLIPRIENGEMPSELGDLLNDIKEARNNSVQVKQKSLADARQQYEKLKSVLHNEPYFDHITWREGDKGTIDVLQIVLLFMIFYPEFSKEAPEGEPNVAYGRKEKCLDSFLRYSETNSQDLETWIEIVPQLLQFFDVLQLDFPNIMGGGFGRITEVRIFDPKLYEKGSKKYRKTAEKTQFFGQEMKYQYPAGWIYPIYAAFRGLVGYDKTSEKVVWKKDPVEFWHSNKERICAAYKPHLNNVGYVTKKVATSATAFGAMKLTVTDLYKSELLKEAGIVE